VLRMSIEKVLSGIEHVHAFTRAVSVGNPREFLRERQEVGGAYQPYTTPCRALTLNREAHPGLQTRPGRLDPRLLDALV
jgi:hypothetical protein